MNTEVLYQVLNSWCNVCDQLDPENHPLFLEDDCRSLDIFFFSSIGEQRIFSKETK